MSVSAGERRAARTWHRVAFGIVSLLWLVELVGVIWAEYHGQPRFQETHPQR